MHIITVIQFNSMRKTGFHVAGLDGDIIISFINSQGMVKYKEIYSTKVVLILMCLH